MNRTRTGTSRPCWPAILFFGCALAAACVSAVPRRASLHGWWSGLGPVVAHDTFPADCSLCHEGTNWSSVREDFTFDHERETGVALEGAHLDAQCLRCHNDYGPVQAFAARGCAGCHEDIHVGQLGPDCTSCHQQWTWQPSGMIELHQRTRLPLTGAHAAVSCRRCHPGAEIGRFIPTDVECVTCHRSDLAQANNPTRGALGWTDRCDRCHLPTSWNQAQLNE